jgi:CRISPR-associated endoribonuclease Cas6
MTFHFDLNLFDVRKLEVLAYFVLAFGQLAREGLGPNRGRVELSGVEQLDEHRCPIAHIYNGTALLPCAAPFAIDLGRQAEAVGRLRIRFVTPMELKTAQQLAGRPEFGIVMARLRDRIGTLRELYGAGPLELDFREFGRRAAAIRLTRCDIRHIEAERRSSRTGQTHSIGGFLGEAEYEGDLTEFVPYLKAGQWTGVGRQTVWGKGEIRIEPICDNARCVNTTLECPCKR